MELKLTKIPNLNTIVIKQSGGKFFLTSRDSIVISEEGLLELLKELAFNKMLNTQHFIDELDFILEEEYRRKLNEPL